MALHDTLFSLISILNSVSLGHFFSALSCDMHAKIVNLLEMLLMKKIQGIILIIADNSIIKYLNPVSNLSFFNIETFIFTLLRYLNVIFFKKGGFSDTI